MTRLPPTFSRSAAARPVPADQFMDLMLRMIDARQTGACADLLTCLDDLNALGAKSPMMAVLLVLRTWRPAELAADPLLPLQLPAGQGDFLAALPRAARLKLSAALRGWAAHVPPGRLDGAVREFAHPHADLTLETLKWVYWNTQGLSKEICDMAGRQALGLVRRSPPGGPVDARRELCDLVMLSRAATRTRFEALALYTARAAQLAATIDTADDIYQMRLIHGVFDRIVDRVHDPRNRALSEGFTALMARLPEAGSLPPPPAPAP